MKKEYFATSYLNQDLLVSSGRSLKVHLEFTHGIADNLEIRETVPSEYQDKE